MAEVVLFHHAQGLTAGCLAFADELRAGGHVVHTPDLYDGRTFPDLAGGMAYAEESGFGEIIGRGRAAAGDLRYPGDRHLFTDRSLPAYDERAAALLLDRVREFLG